MKLSILICSHVSRGPLLDRMLGILRTQKTDDVEIQARLNNDVMKRGSDRNALLDDAQGEYSVFVDDDDMLKDEYVALILKALESGPDIVGITGIVTSLMDATQKRKFVLSLKYEPLFSLPSNDYRDNTYFRYASHLCPIKTELARKIRFPEDMYHEDNGYSDRMKEYAKTHELTEVMIDVPIYYYFSRIRIG
jgi:glycosyltransferase involved in cell wall biosynthesis